MYLIAALCSNSGKSVVSAGLVRALSRRAAITPFKCGPDYIDPMLLSKAANSPAYNLDTVLMGEKGVKELFHNRPAPAIVEGVMGFFDGLNPVTFEGSSYHIAKTLRVPVILLIDAKGMAASVSAIVEGVRSLAKGVTIAGVILNRVSSARQEAILRTSINVHTGVEIFGALPILDELKIPSRKLGLVVPDEEFFEKAGDAVERYISLPSVDRRRGGVCPPVCEANKVAYIAHDSAFSFYYQSTFDMLARSGYTIKKFSPLNNDAVEGADIIYLGGGYPELHAETLAKSTRTRESILEHHHGGVKIFGEGGGFAYMTNSIDGHKMLGIFDVDTVSTDSRRLGYVDCGFAKGHIFSYSKLVNVKEKYYGRAIKLSTGEFFDEGFFKNNAYGGFAHFMPSKIYEW